MNELVIRKGNSKMMVKPNETSSRPIKAIGLLLILQAIGLAGIAAFSILQVDWQQVRLDSSQQQEVVVKLMLEAGQQELVLEAGRAVGVAILFLPSIVLAILGALGFLLFSRRRGWLSAALAQTLCLWACLELYSGWNPGFIYPVMLYCILMVLYLNSYNVRVVFHSRRKPAKWGTAERDLEAGRDG